MTSVAVGAANSAARFVVILEAIQGTRGRVAGKMFLQCSWQRYCFVRVDHKGGQHIIAAIPKTGDVDWFKIQYLDRQPSNGLISVEFSR
jgi:hypothetical protein